jgi:pimeloyl-ACP methyl ester carboxylesterase
VILVHGGVGPELTWEMQEPLAERWTLVIPWRRGFDPSPSAERQDFEVDAGDVGEILVEEESAHLVGLSYGAVGATIAAGAHAARVRSLTVVEPALFGLSRDNPVVLEATPDVEPIVAAGVPRLVVSGGHHPGLEEMCDEVARVLGASRATVPGAGHAVGRARGFNRTLEGFLRDAERRARKP